MMNPSNPKSLLFIAFGLLLFGWAILFLMVMQVLEASFLLSFLSWGASVSGLLLGIVAGASYVRTRNK